MLMESGKAYPCFCDADRLAQIRDHQYASGLKTGYDRRCKQLDPSEVKKKISASEPYVIRLKVPEKGDTKFEDFLRGTISFANDEIDDQILLKSDGFPTYHLANVVDDHLMKITHVIRAEEWISSTPKHLIMYEAFGWEPPVFCHMPLLRNQDTSKISKRKNPCSLHYYKKSGVLPHALVNFLGLQGHSMPDEREKFSLEEFEKDFDLKRVKTRGPVFDLEKLRHLNGLYIREMTADQLAKTTSEHLTYWLNLSVSLAQERMETLSDYVPLMDFIFMSKSAFQPKLEQIVPEKISISDALQLLEDIKKIYGECPWSAKDLDEQTKKYAKQSKIKQGALYMALRVAVTGRLGTPPLMETMAFMERFNVLERLEKTIELLNLKNKA
jgi:glutamyl-tRNA synthetase